MIRRVRLLMLALEKTRCFCYGRKLLWREGSNPSCRKRNRWLMDVLYRTVEQDAEMMRLQILGDPELMRQLREVWNVNSSASAKLMASLTPHETQPDLAAAVQSNPQRFAELLRQQQARHHETELARQREIEALNANPFDVEAQRKIEEAIRQQAVMENMEHAMEYSPESFGRVTML